MAEKTQWIAQPGSQSLFLQSSHVFEVLYEGERGPGKTDALLMSFAQHTGKGYGSYWQGIIFRRTFPELKDIITKSKRWFPVLFPGVEYHEGNHCWTWPTGEKLYFAHMNDPEDYWKYHGHEYPFVGWEELTTWPNDQCYRRMMSCCRSTCPDHRMPRMVRATTNPYGVGHNWVKRRFRLPSMRFTVWFDTAETDAWSGKPIKAKARLAIHGKLDENKILLASDPDYISTLYASAPNKQALKAWLEGSWDIVSGGMFDDVWNNSINVVPAFAIPRGWTIDRAMDWGSAKPCSIGWYAQSDGNAVRPFRGLRNTYGEVPGDVFKIGEWYITTGKPNEGRHLTATQLGQGIKDREIEMGISGRVKPGPADHNIFLRQGGPSIANIMKREHSVAFHKADKGQGSRQHGWQVCRNYMAAAAQPMTDELEFLPREEAGLYVFDNCKYFIDLVPTLPRSDKDPDDINTESEDHIADELRYRLRKMNRQLKTGSV
jgi:hypothetical protein